jgi:CheY-like chemotaxis protein
MLRILIADDQPDVLKALSLLLKGENYQIEAAHSPVQVIRFLEASDFDIVLIDLKTTRATPLPVRRA